MAKTTKRPRRQQGLIGLFGHTYVLDTEINMPNVQYQFRIIRAMRGDRYVVQLFSFVDGSPTEVTVLSEAELLGPNVKLYATEGDWHIGYEKNQARLWQARRAKWNHEREQADADQRRCNIVEFKNDA